MDGYEDFNAHVLPALPSALRDQILTLFYERREDAAFLASLDAFAGGQGFPTNTHDARLLVEQSLFIQGMKVSDAKTATLETQNDDRLEALRNKMTALERALAPLGIDLAAEMHPLSLEGEFSSEDIIRLGNELGAFLDQNAARYLDAAKAHSPGSLVQMFEALEPLQDLSPTLPTLLADYETDYRLAKDALSHPERVPSSLRVTQIALGDSAVTDIDGDIIHGAGGERLDLSRNPPLLSLTGQGGETLEVGAVILPDTRAFETQQLSAEARLRQIDADLDQAEARYSALLDMRHAVEAEGPRPYDDENQRVALTARLLAEMPELKHKLIPGAEACESGAEFLAFLSAFFEAELQLLDQQQDDLLADRDVTEKEIAAIAADIARQNEKARSELETRKGRIRETSRFYAQFGVGAAVERLKPLLAQVKPSQPVILPDGTPITGINPATLEIISPRTPRPEDGTGDFRNRLAMAEILNLALAGKQGEPLSFSA